jgi:hypothetical protein
LINGTIDQWIEACNAVIDSHRWSGKDLAFAFGILL